MATKGKKGAATAAPSLDELAVRVHKASSEDEQIALDRARDLGQDLRQARKLVVSGGWKIWLDKNFIGNRTKAALYMRIADPVNVRRIAHCKGVREAEVALRKPKTAAKTAAKPKRQAGARLRALNAKRREKDSNLLIARVDIVKMVGILEGVDLPALGFGDADEETKEQIFDEICLLWQWVDMTLSVLKVERADQQVRERIRKLREGTNGRTEAEIATALKLADNLARKLERGQLKAV